MINASDKAVLDKCRQAVENAVGQCDIILFGSRARGQAEKYSDYDLLILVDQENDIALSEKILDFIYPIELETDAMISFIVQNKRKWNSPISKAMPLYKNIQKEGIRL